MPPPPKPEKPDLSRDLDHNGIVDSADDRSRDLDHNGVIDGVDRQEKDLNRDHVIDASDQRLKAQAGQTENTVGENMGWTRSGQSWKPPENSNSNSQQESQRQSQKPKIGGA